MINALVRAMLIMILAAFSYLYLQTNMPDAITDDHLMQSFDDVPPDHWAYEEIELIYSYGITVGCSYDPPLYCPDRPPTRAEMAVFAARLLEIIELGGN